MAGIYIHIPFCKKRCNYCDFYSTTDINLRTELTEAIVKEIDLRSNYLPGNIIHTIYFGGGTPSLMQYDDFKKIFDAICSHHAIDKDTEITLEVNPDDLSTEYLSDLKKLPFNRISIGIQSFENNDLKMINRRHSGTEAINAIENLRNAGFDNISIDLIYGLPGQSLSDWEKQLDIALQIRPPHISAYGLTYEEDTVLWKLREANKVSVVDDDTMVKMYELLRDKTKLHGYEAYEISNFSLPGFHSRHNSSYWQQKPYIGIGPSAHSYNGVSRQWNINSLTGYIQTILQGEVPAEIEELSLYDHYNDYIMVALRTSEGLNIKYIEDKFGIELKDYCLQNIKTFIETERIDCSGDFFRLNFDGLIISNHIISEIMKV